MSIQVEPNSSPRIITIPESDGDSITVQVLVNQIRNWEQEPINLGYIKLLSASGKEDLGGEPRSFVGITAKLENAKLKFADRASPTVCYVSGGNLVAVDGNGDPIDAIEPSVNTTVVIAQSTSASITELGAPTAQENADTVMGRIVDGVIDVNLLLQILAARFAGEVAELPDGISIVYRDQAGQEKVTERFSKTAVERVIA